ncbi:MAG: cupin domain-containing protein [Alphaproteobacteria bacterium]|nr:cupin domain-containing protein [Alphaproteobacteria bacterium]MCZ6839463.1 cupin domain-containing protein [Alphaproteobacteria bacterium]MCZ6847157.1 cupin domain-containing protein [Alphaproteobacteria bacterium]
MSYSTPAAPQLDALDDLASRYVDVDAMPWTDLPFEGVQAKVLLRDEHGVRTALVRMAPGAEIPFHEHTGLEQTYMLEGSLSDHEGEATAGQYVWRLKGNRHIARSPDGALMLVMFERPNVFLSGELEGLTMEQFMAQQAAE